MRLPCTLMLLAAAVLAPLGGCAATSDASTPQPVEAPTGPLPDDSLYQLATDLTNQAGQSVDLALYRGHPTIVTMFYASCPSACPMLISDLHRIEDKLTDEQRSALRVVMVSFDPETDTPQALTTLATERSIDLSRWTLASAAPDDVRELAAVLGISYRRLDSGHYNHSAVITLLDAEGRVQAKIDGLNQSNDAVVAALQN